MPKRRDIVTGSSDIAADELVRKDASIVINAKKINTPYTGLLNIDWMEVWCVGFLTPSGLICL